MSLSRRASSLSETGRSVAGVAEAGDSPGDGAGRGSVGVRRSSSLHPIAIAASAAGMTDHLAPCMSPPELRVGTVPAHRQDAPADDGSQRKGLRRTKHDLCPWERCGNSPRMTKTLSLGAAERR